MPPCATDPSIVIVGASKYPLPLFVTSTDVILPPVPTFVIAVAPDPPPPDKVIFGGPWYPEPESAICISFTIKPTLSNQFFSGYAIILPVPVSFAFCIFIGKGSIFCVSSL